MKPTVYVFGEIHTNKDSVNSITEQIKQIKPTILLHELLYDDKCMYRTTIWSRLRSCANGAKCDPRLNKDIYQLGYDLNMKLIGIDLVDSKLHRNPLRTQFAKREFHMLKMVKAICSKEVDRPLTIVVVVGDTHLREKTSLELGLASKLMTYIKSQDNFIIQRAPKAIQEMP